MDFDEAVRVLQLTPDDVANLNERRVGARSKELVAKEAEPGGNGLRVSMIKTAAKTLKDWIKAQKEAPAAEPMSVEPSAPLSEPEAAETRAEPPPASVATPAAKPKAAPPSPNLSRFPRLRAFGPSIAFVAGLVVVVLGGGAYAWHEVPALVVRLTCVSSDEFERDYRRPNKCIARNVYGQCSKMIYDAWIGNRSNYAGRPICPGTVPRGL